MLSLSRSIPQLEDLDAVFFSSGRADAKRSEPTQFFDVLRIDVAFGLKSHGAFGDKVC